MQSLVAKINTSQCKKCSRCADACENKTIKRDGAFFRVLSELCRGCGTCVGICPWNNVKLVEK